jgi:hypothetical protein
MFGGRRAQRSRIEDRGMNSSSSAIVALMRLRGVVTFWATERFG